MVAPVSSLAPRLHQLRTARMLEKQAALPLALLPALGAAGKGLMAAFTAYSAGSAGKKTIEAGGHALKGDFGAAGRSMAGAGADALMAVPGFGQAGKMIQGGSRLARGGKIGIKAKPPGLPKGPPGRVRRALSRVSQSGAGQAVGRGTQAIGRGRAVGVVGGQGGGRVYNLGKRLEQSRVARMGMVPTIGGSMALGHIAQGGQQTPGQMVQPAAAAAGHRAASGQGFRVPAPAATNWNQFRGVMPKVGQYQLQTLLDLRNEVLRNPNLGMDKQMKMLREIDALPVEKNTMISRIMQILSPELRSLAAGAAGGAATQILGRLIGAM